MKMEKVKFLIFSLIFIVTGCNGQQKFMEKYASRNKDSVSVRAPYLVLSQLPYDKEMEPFIICLREEYAFRFGDIDMHLEHSDYVRLYSAVLDLPEDFFQKYDLESFKLELEKFYFPQGKKPVSEEVINSIYEVNLVQRVNLSNTKSLVFSSERNFQYELEKIDGKWFIVGKGPCPAVPTMFEE